VQEVASDGGGAGEGEDVDVRMQTDRAPAVGPSPATTFRTPAGSPASVASPPSSSADSGEFSDGFSTTVQPAASAGATFQLASVKGKFHGTTAPTTPAGSRVTSASASGAVCGDSSVSLSANCPYQRKVLTAARSSMSYASVIGLPISRLTVRASSARRSSRRSAMRSSTRPRSTGASRGQAPESKARRAAATAAFTSASPPSATRASTWPSRGETTAKVRPPPGSSVPSM
jgi:hypothetical protein